MKKKYFYLMSNVDSAIGNFSEIIFYALLKAKRKNENFVLIRKYIFLRSTLSNKFGFRQPQALYKVKTEYSQSNSRLGHILALYGGASVFLSYLNESIKYKSIKFINKIFGKTVLIPIFNPSIPSSGSHDLFNIHSQSSFSISKEDESYWHKALSNIFEIELDKNTCIVAKRAFTELGLKKYPWHVCLHTRTPFFYSSTNDLFRNANIENYYDAIRYITGLGGAVIRMGDPMYNVEEIDGFINYPNSTEKSEGMDLYLIKNCKFYIGTSSGIYDTAALFGVPILGINITSFIYISPFKECDSFIYKHIFSKERNKLLSFKEALNEPFLINANLFNASELKIFHEKYEFIENTPEEILQSVKNMISNLEANTYKKNEVQRQFEKHIKETVMKWIRVEPYFEKKLDEKYRSASKLYFSGSIDKDFANKYYDNLSI